VSVVDREAGWKCEALRVRYPQLDNVCELIAHQIDVRSPAFERAVFVDEAEGWDDLDVAYVCLRSSSLGLRAGLTLLQHTRARGTAIVIRMAEDTGLASLLRSECERTPSFASLHAFALLDRTCTAELVLGGSHEVLAQAIHREYVLGQAALGNTPQENPAMVPWASLPERLRESNRRQVDHIGLKLEAVGCGIVPLRDWDAGSFQFAEREVEVMARMEHERWVQDLSQAGWRFAPGARDPVRRAHPALLPWEELPEEEREKNRATVRELPAFLVRAGLQIRRGV
jgi:hypothetical protein